jgi:aspartate racemase
VIGGMGPLATVDFMHKVLVATPASTDQEHVPMLVSSIPQVPDRTAAFHGDGPSPLEAIVSSGLRLVSAGADLIVMPCNTAHLWFDAVQEALGRPMIHLVDAALDDVFAMVGPDAPVGLLATDATLASGLYVNRASRCGRGPVRWLLPTARETLECVGPGIAAVKAGELARGADRLGEAADALARRGARAIVLGCTEIPLVLGHGRPEIPVVDATAALARRAVAWALGQRASALAS